MTRPTPRPPVPAPVAALATLRLRGCDPPPDDIAAAWGVWAPDGWREDATEADAVADFCAAWEAGEIQGQGVE